MLLRAFAIILELSSIHFEVHRIVYNALEVSENLLYCTEFSEFETIGFFEKKAVLGLGNQLCVHCLGQNRNFKNDGERGWNFLETPLPTIKLEPRKVEGE